MGAFFLTIGDACI